MDQLYVLNDGFRHSEIIDSYETLLWTERYASEGEVLLTVSDTPWNRATLREGVFLSIPESREVMLLETRSSEKGVLTIAGTSLAGFLKNRMLRDTWRNDRLYWSINQAPGIAAGSVVREMCTTGVARLMEDDYVVTGGAAEIFPTLSLGPLASGIPVYIAMKYGNVYDQVKELCDIDELGFSLYPQNITETSHELIFTTYRGLDRTSGQTVNSIVRFSPALDSLTDTKELRSIAGYKNVAYAFAPNIKATTYIVGVAYANASAAASRGFARRTLMVSADDISEADLTTTAGINQLREELRQRALDGLANNNYVRMVDGELVPQSGFVYDEDYKLGDIIDLGSATGESSTARVTEYIRSKDASGYTEYPTLSVIS